MKALNEKGSLFDHIKKLQAGAILEATVRFGEFKSGVKGVKGHYERFRSACEENKRVSSLIKEHLHPYYISNYDNSLWLYDQFLSRQLLLNVDDSEGLSDAVLLGMYQRFISDFETNLSKGIPKYSLKIFRKGQKYKYLKLLEEVTVEDEISYHQMWYRQTQQLINLVDAQFNFYIQQIQKYCNTLSNSSKFAEKEIKKIKGVFNTGNDGKRLKKNLSRLLFLQGFDFSKMDEGLIEKNFQIYKSRQIVPYQPHFRTITLLLDPKRIYSSGDITESTIFYVISKIENWLKLVLKGQPIQQVIVEINYRSRLELIIKDGEEELKQIKKEIDKHVDEEEFEKEVIKKFLLTEFEYYRARFNLLDKKNLCSVVRTEKRDILNILFIMHSFLLNDLEEQAKAIRNAFIIFHATWAIVSEYRKKFSGEIIYSTNATKSADVSSLLQLVVLEKETFNELMEKLPFLPTFFYSYSMPVEISNQNEYEYLRNFFTQSLRRLNLLIDEADPVNKTLYINSRIEKLRIREIESSRRRDETTFSKNALFYTSHLKDFLQVKIESLQKTFRQNDLAVRLKSPEHEKNGEPQKGRESESVDQLNNAGSETQAFEKVFTSDERRFILKMLEDLAITHNGIFALGAKSKGAIKGVVQALLENNFAATRNTISLCKCIGKKIGLEIKSHLPNSTIMYVFLERSRQYIHKSYKKS